MFLQSSYFISNQTAEQSENLSDPLYKCLPSIAVSNVYGYRKHLQHFFCGGQVCACLCVCVCVCQCVWCCDNGGGCRSSDETQTTFSNGGWGGSDRDVFTFNLKVFPDAGSKQNAFFFALFKNGCCIALILQMKMRWTGPLLEQIISQENELETRASVVVVLCTDFYFEICRSPLPLLCLFCFLTTVEISLESSL